MKFCIQDPAEETTYLFDEVDIESFAIDPDDYSQEVDVILVVPGDDLLQELPATRLTDSMAPVVQLVDPTRNASWVFPLSALRSYVVDVPPANLEDVAWFAMPTARELIAAVPIFRKALVQHGC